MMLCASEMTQINKFKILKTTNPHEVDFLDFMISECERSLTDPDVDVREINLRKYKQHP